MTAKVESFTTKVKRNLRVIDLISSHEKERGAYAVHACHDKKPVVGTKEKCLSHISSDHLLILSIFLSSISSFLQMDTGWLNAVHFHRHQLSLWLKL